MTLAAIIRAQLADGRPLRVTRALLEALEEPPADPLPWLMESRRFLDAVDGFRAEGESPSDAVKRLRRLLDEARAEVERLRAALEVERSLECDASAVIREAEERGARWALVAVAMWSGGAWAASVAEARAERICAEARKAGDHG